MGDEDDAPDVPGRWPQIVLAVILVGVFLAAQLFSDRPQLPLKRPWIDHVADLPANADKMKYTEFVYNTTASFPTGRRLTVSKLYERPAGQPTSDWYRENPAKLGYSIDEYVALSMPFFATRDHGYTLYVDNYGEMSFAPLKEDEGLKLLREELKAPIGEGFTFRWWNHMWGWIPLLSLIGIIVLEGRRARIKRMQSGIL